MHIWCWCSSKKTGSLMQIRAWREEYCCTRPLRIKMVTADFIARRVRTCSGKSLIILKGMVLHDLKVTVGTKQVYRTLMKVRAMVAGDLAKQYELMHAHCNMIEKTSPKSKTKIEV